MATNIFDQIHNRMSGAGQRLLRREPIGAQAAEAAKKVASTPALAPEVAGATNRVQPVGAVDPASGREITQPSDNPAVNQALATEAMSNFAAGLEAAIHGIPGARLQAVRPAKNPTRLAEKVMLEKQPPQTVSDYGAAQISVDSPQARDAVAAAVKRRFRVIREIDRFQQGDPVYGYRSLNLQVQMPNGASEELQITPREVMDANKREHRDYKAAREAAFTGKNAEAVQAAARALNDAAMRKFEERNAAAHLEKGSEIALRGGLRGKISWIDPKGKLVRVQTSDGRNLTLRVKDLL